MLEESNLNEIVNKEKEFKNDIETIINKKSETWTDKVAMFFDRIEFLELAGELKQEVAIKVKKNTTPDRLYRIEIFLSSLIAALGLLQNSVAVVIGAMLIAPLLRPINGTSFAISKGEKGFFWISLRVILVSILISVVMGFISAKIIGFTQETSEILGRTSPNIIDLFIAIFSAMIAVLSLGFSRLGESIAGVAMAASLMPPLAVVGIELALGNYVFAWGAFMLFLANLVAIILVGVIIFWLYGFTPNNGDKQKISVKRFSFIVIVVLIISIPLFHSLSIIKQETEIRKDSRVYLENILKQENTLITVSSLDIESVSDKNIKIIATIKLPEGINFYDTFKKQLDFELSKKLGKDVELNIDLIRTANIVSSDNVNNIDNQIYDFISNEFKTNYKNLNLLSLEINKVNNSYGVKVIIGVDNEQNFDQNIFTSLENRVNAKFNENISYNFIPLSIYSKKKDIELTEVQKQKLQLETEFRDFINANLIDGISLRSLEIVSDLNSKLSSNLVFDVEVSSNDELAAILVKLRNFADAKNISLDMQFFTYKELKISGN